MRVKECKDVIDIIIAIESDELIIEDKSDLLKVFGIVADLKNSQGFYSRLYVQMKELYDETNFEIDYPVSL